MSDKMITDQPVPSPTNPVGVTAAVDASRDLVAEKDKERSADAAQAKSSVSKFQTRKFTPMPKLPASAEYETLIFKAAANNPLRTISNSQVSTTIPDLSTIFFIQMYMDHLMASTKRWIDNCQGWAPPISQAFLSVVILVQIFRAMDASGAIAPCSEIKIFLDTFVNVFPLSEIWIPGPLVAALRSLSSFFPALSERFGNVGPIVPEQPGWTAARLFALGPYNNSNFIVGCLPNPSVYFDRLRNICILATAAGVSQSSFSNNTNGPNYLERICGTQVDNQNATNVAVTCPGLKFAYPDNLQLWQNAASALRRYCIPAGIDTVANSQGNNWASFMRFANNEHQWFGPVAATMARYSQFFQGSVTLDELAPNCSAALAIKARYVGITTIHTLPNLTPQAGNHSSHEHGNPNEVAHFILENNTDVELNVQLALEGVPDAHRYAALSFALNAYADAPTQAAARQGPFWTLGPDIADGNNIKVLQGMLATINREYHSDVRIPAGKQ